MHFSSFFGTAKKHVHNSGQTCVCLPMSFLPKEKMRFTRQKKSCDKKGQETRFGIALRIALGTEDRYWATCTTRSSEATRPLLAALHTRRKFVNTRSFLQFDTWNHSEGCDLRAVWDEGVGEGSSRSATLINPPSLPLPSPLPFPDPRRPQHVGPPFRQKEYIYRLYTQNRGVSRTLLSGPIEFARIRVPGSRAQRKAENCVIFYFILILTTFSSCTFSFCFLWGSHALWQSTLHILHILFYGIQQHLYC